MLLLGVLGAIPLNLDFFLEFGVFCIQGIDHSVVVVVFLPSALRLLVGCGLLARCFVRLGVFDTGRNRDQSLG